jgi:hypothetical protein
MLLFNQKRKKKKKKKKKSQVNNIRSCFVFVIVDLQQQHQPWPSHAGAPTNCARSDHHLIRALHLTADLRHQAPLQQSAPLAAHKDPPASFTSQPPFTADLSRFVSPDSLLQVLFCVFCYLVLGLYSIQKVYCVLSLSKSKK